MPIISQFYGIIIKMFYDDIQKHNLPHLHAEYAEFSGVFDLDGNVLEGDLPSKKEKLVQVWIDIHQEELKALWTTVQRDKEYFRIEPLR